MRSVLCDLRCLARLTVAAGVVAAGVVAALGCAGTAATQAPPPKIALVPCERPSVEGPIECGTVNVPENRDRPGRMIALSVLVVRALPTPEARQLAEPIFFFTGGPGSAASNSAGWLSSALRPLRETRDFVFIDQRGTGASNLLTCAFPPGEARRLAPVFSPSEAETCRKELETRADLRYYTTGDASRDVEDVRRALGYERINLHGSSYGTRAAWDYAARYPTQVRSAVLYGPAPPGFYLPLPFSRGLDVALEGLATDCAADPGCAKRFPAFRDDLRKAFDGLAQPVRVPVTAADGTATDAPFTRGELAEALRYLMYEAGLARRIPLLISHAAAGDYVPISRAAITQRRPVETLARGMYLTVTCTEDTAFITEADILRETANTRLGDYRVRQQIETCREWPRGEAPTPKLREPIAVPALVLVGQYDPATTLAEARAGMRLLPNGRLVIVPHGAHSLSNLGIDACLNGAVVDFVKAGSAANLDASCFASARRLPFILQ